MNKRVFFCLFLAFLLFLFTPSICEAQSVDLANSGNWNIRFDPPTTGNFFSYGSTSVADVNNDGENDLIVGSWFEDNNSRANSGSLWIIYSSLLQNLSGTGNTIDLSDPSNWNIRVDGAVAGHFFSTGGVRVADVDGNGKNDLVASSYAAGYNSRATSGSVYVIYDSILDDYTGTGNTIDLSTTSNWNLRYDGAVAGNQLTFYGGLNVLDVDGDGKNDLLLGARSADYNSRTDSGSVWVVYNTLIDDYTGTGNTIDLSTTSNWNLRYDGATATEFLGNNLDSLSEADLDGDGKNDLLLGAYAKNNTLTDSGSLYIISSTLVDDYTGTGNIVDLSTSTNYTISLLGAYQHGFLGIAYSLTDLDGDGSIDLVVGGYDSDDDSTNGNGKGVVYVIYNSILDDYFSSTGNDLDMGTSTNYNIRYTGPAYNTNFGSTIFTKDVTNDGLVDLSIGAIIADNNSRTDSGSAYLIDNTLIDDYSGTGNNVDITSTTGFSRRYDGPAATAYITSGSFNVEDFNNDGNTDYIIGSYNYSGQGAVWVIENFPHTITRSSISQTGNKVTIKGVINAQNSTTNISGVQYKIDSNTQTTGWGSAGCSADDGSFNSTNESFTCNISNVPLSPGDHSIYIRSYDQNGIYSSQSLYLTSSYLVGGGSPSSFVPQIPLSSNQNFSGAMVDAVREGVFTNHPEQKIVAFVEPKTFGFDAYLSAQPTTISSDGRLPNPITGSVETYTPKYKFAGNKIGIGTLSGTAWQVGSIYNVWYKAYGPGNDTQQAAKIIPQLQTKPSLLALSYNDSDLISNYVSLYLAHSIDGRSWTLLPQSVVDKTNKTVAVITPVGGYYTIVARVNSVQPVLGESDEKITPQPSAIPEATQDTPETGDTNTKIPNPLSNFFSSLLSDFHFTFNFR